MDSSAESAKSEFGHQAGAAAAVLQILAEMKDRSADQASVEINAAEPFAVLYKEKRPAASLKFPNTTGRALESRIMLLAAYWSEQVQGEPPVILSISEDRRETIGVAVTIKRKTGSTDRVLVLEKVSTPSLGSIELSDANRAALESATAQKQGFIIVDSSRTPHSADARAVILAMRPDALYLPLPRSAAAMVELLSQGRSRLVVVGLAGLDAAQLIYQTIGAVSSPAEKEQIIDLTHLAFVHFSVRRTCAGCLRQTSISPTTIEQLPLVLRPETATYLFGRGCDACGHSAYSGRLGLHSVVNLTPGLKGLLKSSAPIDAFIHEAYRAGSRAVLEDGLEKIFKGMTSFEEVFAVTTVLPPGYTEAIETAKRRPPPSTSRLSVLVVEDDDDQRGILETVFRTAGYDVAGAASGTQALEVLSNRRADIVICDLMMPGMNGEELVLQIRRSPKLKDIPVLVLTAMTSPDAEYKLLENGADDFCDKNVKRKVLLKRVELLLGRKNRNPVSHMAE